VYEEIKFDPADSPRERQHVVEGARDRYAAVLRRLVSVGEDSWTTEDKRVRALWPSQRVRAISPRGRSRSIQLGQSDRFREGLVRSGEWESHIVDTLATLGLPRKSRRSARRVLVQHRGLFEGRRRGHVAVHALDRPALHAHRRGRRRTHGSLQVDGGRGPAAADNYQLLGSWPLAITAYNTAEACAAPGARWARTTS